MAAWCGNLMHLMRRRANEMRRREQLSRRNQFIIACSEQECRRGQSREIDRASKRTERTCGELVALIEPFHDLDEIAAGQIESPRVPFAKPRFDPGESFGADRRIDVQQLPDILGTDDLRSPEL